MATAVTSNKVASNCSLKLYDHDPGGTSATVVSTDGGTTKNYLAMKEYGNFAVLAMTSVSASSSGITKVEILGATDSSGTNATVIVDSGTVAADALQDQVFVECTAEQINEVGKAAGYNFSHVTARLTCSNAGDEAVVLMARFNPRYPQSGLTPATTIA